MIRKLILWFSREFVFPILTENAFPILTEKNVFGFWLENVFGFRQKTLFFWFWRKQCFRVLTEIYVFEVLAGKYVFEFWWENTFLKIWRENAYSDFGEKAFSVFGIKQVFLFLTEIHVLGFGEKLVSSVLVGKCVFRVLVKNSLLRFHGYTCF